MTTKDNTMLYVALAGAALFMFSRSASAAQGVTAGSYAAMSPAQQAAYRAQYGSAPTGTTAGTVTAAAGAVGAVAAAGSSLVKLFTAGNSSPATAGNAQTAMQAAGAANQLAQTPPPAQFFGWSNSALDPLMSVPDTSLMLDTSFTMGNAYQGDPMAFVDNTGIAGAAGMIGGYDPTAAADYPVMTFAADYPVMTFK